MGLRPEAAHHYGFDFAPPLLDRQEFAPGSDRGVETLTTQALDFIERNRERPWFCYLSHHMIHGVVVAPDEVTEKYRQRGYGDNGPNRAVYLAGLECIDRSIGRLLNRLEELGEADDTIVVFLSDNGGIDWRLGFKDLPTPHRPDTTFPIDTREYDNAPLRAGKGSIYEGGVRVPMIIRWPGRVARGKVIETPVHAIDILPTCCAAAGATVPSDHAVDGLNLTALLDGDDSQLADRPIFQYYPFYDLRWGLTPSASIRVGDYKLIEFFGDRVDRERRYAAGHRIELYDLRNDIGEKRNLAEEQSERTNAMRKQLHDWVVSVGAEVPTNNSRFDADRAFRETRRKPDWLKPR